MICQVERNLEHLQISHNVLNLVKYYTMSLSVAGNIISGHIFNDADHCFLEAGPGPRDFPYKKKVARFYCGQQPAFVKIFLL